MENGTKRFQALKGDQCLGLMLPNIKAMMTGVSRIEQTKTGLVTLYYTDGSKESAIMDDDISNFDSCFPIISFVQAEARKSA